MLAHVRHDGEPDLPVSGGIQRPAANAGLDVIARAAGARAMLRRKEAECQQWPNGRGPCTSVRQPRLARTDV
jgi:hypothetical protein